MAYSVKYKITSQQPCQIPAIGEFAAGETKELIEFQLNQFQVLFGYPVGKGLFPSWVSLEVILVNDAPSQEVEEPKEDEEVEVEESDDSETEAEEAQ